jgi:hypothetical protein
MCDKAMLGGGKAILRGVRKQLWEVSHGLQLRGAWSTPRNISLRMPMWEV